MPDLTTEIAGNNEDGWHWLTVDEDGAEVERSEDTFLTPYAATLAARKHLGHERRRNYPMRAEQ